MGTPFLPQIDMIPVNGPPEKGAPILETPMCQARATPVLGGGIPKP